MPDLLAPVFDWATDAGPPNWAFVVALLSSPHLWSRYVKRAAEQAYARYTGVNGSDE